MCKIKYPSIPNSLCAVKVVGFRILREKNYGNGAKWLKLVKKKYNEKKSFPECKIDSINARSTTPVSPQGLKVVSHKILFDHNFRLMNEN